MGLFQYTLWYCSCVLHSWTRASESRPNAGLPNLFGVAGFFHMKKFIEGLKRLCDVAVSYCDDLEKFYAITRDDESYSCTQCCRFVWM